MENKVPQLVDEAIVNTFEDLKHLEGEERANAIKELTQLHEMRVEEAKIEVEREEKANQGNEMAIKREQLKSQNLDRWVNMGVQVGLTIGSWIAFTCWQKSEQRFEMTGSANSPIFRNLLSRMTPNLRK